jgi:hypothetical protein
MTKKDPAVPQPSYLPPNPSVGELVTEIDRARHEAARTVTALVAKFDVKTKMRADTHDRVAVVREQVVAATPDSLAKSLGALARYAKRMPVPVRIGAVLVLMVLLRGVRSHRRTR